MRNKYGIIDIGTLQIELLDVYDSSTSADIQSLLSEQQKSILKDIAYENNSKLVYGTIKCIDDDGFTLYKSGIISIGYRFGWCLEINGRNNDDTFVHSVTIGYDIENDLYYANS